MLKSVICGIIHTNKILSMISISKKSTVVGLLMMALVVTPFGVSAATYQPQTKAEIIAYLYGRISQLMEIKQSLERGDTITEATRQTDIGLVTVDTHKATEIEDTTAVLRGEVSLFGEATADAWFEYGQDEDFLDQKTRKQSVRTVYDRPVRISVSRLEEDERYYFRIVALDRDGNAYYGSVFQFRTDEED